VDHTPSISLLSVLQHIHTYTWTLQSDDARRFAHEVAEASSRGWITTEIVPGSNVYGRQWKITLTGIAALMRDAHLIAEEEIAHYQEKPLYCYVVEEVASIGQE
jgi:hypothetical protein